MHAAVFTNESDIDIALSVQATVRKQRADAAGQNATTSDTPLCLPDGPEQQARHQAMRKAAMGRSSRPDVCTGEVWHGKIVCGVATL